MKVLETIGVILLFLGLFVLGIAWGAYLIMLCMGGIGHMTGHLALAIGFWPCFLIALMMALFIGGASKS